MNPLLTMREALTNPKIMGNAFAGPTWLAWRSLLIASRGEELNDEERQVFTELTQRHHEPLERVDEVCVLKGRRGGFTTMAGASLVFAACLIDYSDVLGPGERGLALCIAPNARQAQIAFQRAEGLIDASEMLRKMVIGRTAESLTLSNNIDLEVRPPALDTCAASLPSISSPTSRHYFQVEGSNTDAEILNSVRPSLITTGGQLLIGSTPYAEEGELYRLYRNHFGPNGDPKLLVAKGTSRQTNPTLPELVITRALERDPLAARSEFLCEFRADISTFIERVIIERCIDRGVTSRPYDERFQYICFADVASGIASGGDGDRYAWSIGHGENDQIVLDFATERKPPFDAGAITAELASI